ncbi:MAG: hypothetical protein H0V88_13735 [Pyrinomonadaceae bacterium]|nr:hypothetical protein [Pyrinomonadaceae bacterium]
MNSDSNEHNRSEDFRAFSSINDDVWHNDRATGAYEWWYFDATSDDGRDVFVVIFLTNFIFSPRYNRSVKGLCADNASTPARFPAVSIWWYRDGKVFLRTIKEFSSEHFSANTDAPACRIGNSSFHLHRSNGEAHYRLQLDETLRHGRKLQASLDWLVSEGDFDRELNDARPAPSSSGHEWNMVAPKCHVSGTLILVEPNGGKQAHEFCGTGYHDHNRDGRPLVQTVAAWQWGRAHFADRTIVFYRYAGRDSGQTHVSRLFIAHDNKLVVCDAQFVEADMRRDLFGLRYPRMLHIRFRHETGAPAALRVEQRHVLESSFFYLRFAGKAWLETKDEKEQQASLVSEYLAPRALGWRSLHWLINMRIGRENRSSFLP